MTFTISAIIRLFNKKEIFLYHSHRNNKYIIDNPNNRKDFIFINMVSLWKMIPIKNKFKIKSIIIYSLLNFINPKYILSTSWTSSRDRIYKLWTSRHSDSKFIVLHHGTYVGGIVLGKQYKYTNCDVFLTWGEYFTRMFKEFNQGKKVRIISFGNPVYNFHNRNNFSYKNHRTGKILLLPTAINKERIKPFYKLVAKLRSINFDILLKEHNFQGRTKPDPAQYPEIEGVEKTNKNTYEMLAKNEFDFIISDYSTALLDAIFFKNKVIFFSPNSKHTEYTKNEYSRYLNNAFYYYERFINKDDWYCFVDVEAQEKLLSNMVHQGDNILNNYM